MAKKSKTQKAKAQAARAAKKAAKAEEEQKAIETPVESSNGEAKSKRKFFKKEEEPKKEKTAAELRQERRDKKMAEKEKRAPKQHGKIVQFFIDVKAEMKRVTWPEPKDVRQWTGVVIGALVFFGVYVAILDSWIVTPFLVFISSLG